MTKPDKFMIASAPQVDEALAKLGPSYENRYILTSAIAWDDEKDKPCLLFSVFAGKDENGAAEEAYAQVMYFDDVSWVPITQIQQLNRGAVERHLIEQSEKVDGSES